jgi:hypothetical protein
VRHWRLAVAHVANDLVDTLEGRDLRVHDAELTGLRRTLVDVGVEPEELAPVSPRFDPALAVAAVASTSRPTIVLYSIRLDDAVRFVRLGTDGLRAVSPDASAQAGAADAYVAALRSEPGALVDKVAEQLPRLLEDAAPALGRVLDDTLDGAANVRLLWVPHGSLVAVPLLACPTAPGHPRRAGAGEPRAVARPRAAVASGTVAQSEVNEAIGIPVGALAAGASAVVGAVWPVSRIAAVATCARFLRELASGAASPEALQTASVWLRDATYEDVLGELDRVDHALASMAALDVRSGSLRFTRSA